LVFTDGANWSAENIKAENKNLVTGKKAGPELNAEKTKYLLVSHQRNTGQNLYIKIATKSFQNVAKFRNPKIKF
jgi:hypothetical protein